MTAFIALPRLHVRPLPTQNRITPTTCTLSNARRSGRRRMTASKFMQSSGLEGLPPEFLAEVKRLIRARTFLDCVRESLKWPYTRFTNVLFLRPPLSHYNWDGIPENMRELSRRVDFEFVDVPPGIIDRATRKVGMDPISMKLCAVFEMYGMDTIKAQEREREAEKRTQREIDAWMDVGLSLRTETDVGSGDIYKENLMDFVE